MSDQMELDRAKGYVKVFRKALELECAEAENVYAILLENCSVESDKTGEAIDPDTMPVLEFYKRLLKAEAEFDTWVKVSNILN